MLNVMDRRPLQLLPHAREHTIARLRGPALRLRTGVDILMGEGTGGLLRRPGGGSSHGDIMPVSGD